MLRCLRVSRWALFSTGASWLAGIVHGLYGPGTTWRTRELVHAYCSTNGRTINPAGWISQGAIVDYLDRVGGESAWNIMERGQEVGAASWVARDGERFNRISGSLRGVHRAWCKSIFKFREVRRDLLVLTVGWVWSFLGQMSPGTNTRVIESLRRNYRDLRVFKMITRDFL